jgi:glycine/D-amino acid oxidase-like deaminating enzyme
MPADLPTRSPWLEQLRHGDPPRPLDRDLVTDVAVVGAGIAGASTSFFLLRETDQRVALVERGAIGHGATGHNAGQLATYFERSLSDLVDEFGVEQAIDAQRGVESAWDLIETMAAECGSDQQLDRFNGNMGMFNLDHVVVHLRHSALRRDHGLAVFECLVSERAPFLADIPAEFADLYDVVPDRRVRASLGPGTDRYCAVLCSPIGVANGALLVQHVVDHLLRTQPDRFVYVDHTKVDHVALHADHAELHANDHTIHAARVVLCTNGFLDHVLENVAGESLDHTEHHRLIGTKGYMTGVTEPGRREPNAYSFIRNEQIGDDEVPYLYVTRRPWNDGQMLVVFGGPEEELDDASTYDADGGFPAAVIDEFDNEVAPLAYPVHRPGEQFDFRWHGLMGYTTNKLRLIGPEPRNPVLLYNLGCNGVGFMPSIYGGHRIARMLAGDEMRPSVFDPPA